MNIRELPFEEDVEVEIDVIKVDKQHLLFEWEFELFAVNTPSAWKKDSEKMQKGTVKVKKVPGEYMGNAIAKLIYLKKVS